MKYLSVFLIFLVGCSTHEPLPTLHNYPVFPDMDCPEEYAHKHEAQLRKEAKALNMSYVNYLHKITKERLKRVYKDAPFEFNDDTTKK